MDERTIVSKISGWLNETGLFESTVEEHVHKPAKDKKISSLSSKRFDLLVKYNQELLFNGEFKLPPTEEKKGGRTDSPRDYALVSDSANKADEKASPFYLTSNLNETVTFDRRDSTRPRYQQEVESIRLDDTLLIKREEDFDNPNVELQLKNKMIEIAKKIVHLKAQKEAYRPLDQIFQLGLTAQLDPLARSVMESVPLDVLGRWWKKQKYLPVKEFGHDEKKRIADYSAYILVNKLMFYYVLKRAFPSLPIIHIENLDKIDEVKNYLTELFEQAKKISGDYETVFIEDEADTIPFVSENALTHLQNLIKYLNEFQLDTLSQDTLGNLYDRLLAPEERHKHGQYYTPIPVVDLINALTIRSPDDRVLDPACGSGTFLTRAFDRKLRLYSQDNDPIREKIVQSLFGVEIAAYPAHLATISIAIKHLRFSPECYPNIVCKSFFEVHPEEVIPKLASHTEKAVTLDQIIKKVKFSPVDAVVSNLPYVRQEEIENKEEIMARVRSFLSVHGFKSDPPVNTSDLHLYFWFYLLPFLKNGSRVGFLTSDTWLNVEYGDCLKKFILDHFKIVAVVDSAVERWFEDALVNTVITILERCDDEKERANNIVRFVRLNKKLKELEPDVVKTEELAKAIEVGRASAIMSVREKKQEELQLKGTLEDKWYPYLRAPDCFFKLVNTNKMVPLEEVAELKRGFTTGANKFFYVDDITDGLTDEVLRKTYGLNPTDRLKLRVIRNGTKTDHVIEAKYLKPILRSPKEFTVSGSLVVNKTKKKVVIIEEADIAKIDFHAAQYLRYGEINPPGESYSETKTCAGRKPWWKLTSLIKPEIVFAMYFSSTFIYPRIDANLFLDHTMYNGNMKEEYKDDLLALHAFFNSTLSYLYPDLYGRNYGGGGAPVGFMVYEMQKLPVPKPKNMRPYYKTIVTLIKQLEKRQVGSVFDEIWSMKTPFSFACVKPDRLELDRLLLKLLGFKNPDNFLAEWYPAVVRIVKERLDKAASLKAPKGKKRASFDAVADTIIAKMDEKQFPEEYVNYANVRVVEKLHLKRGSRIIYKGYLLDKGAFVIMVDDEVFQFKSAAVAEFVFYAMLQGKTEVMIPENVVEVVHQRKRDLQKMKQKIKAEIEERITDEKGQKLLFKKCLAKLKLSP